MVKFQGRNLHLHPSKPKTKKSCLMQYVSGKLLNPVVVLPTKLHEVNMQCSWNHGCCYSIRLTCTIQVIKKCGLTSVVEMFSRTFKTVKPSFMRRLPERPRKDPYQRGKCIWRVREFQVEIHFHPCHLQPKTHARGRGVCVCVGVGGGLLQYKVTGLIVRIF